jgi:hypothetical protein
MKKLTLAFALLLTATAAAHAQQSANPYEGAPVANPHRDALAIKDPVHRDEALIANSKSRRADMESEARRVGRTKPPSFKAEIVVTNSAAKAIKYVNWTATLTDPATGDVLQTYDVTTKANIAPGRKKKLAKRLRTPRPAVVSATAQNPARPPVADLKVAVTSVTYADGSTSTRP